MSWRRCTADHVDDVWFSERPAAKDFESHFCAIKAAAWVAEDLDIAMPRIRWFSESVGTGDAKSFKDGPGTVGKAAPGEIWLHTDLDPRGAIRSAAHEMRHLYQYTQGKFRGDLIELARDYGDRSVEVDARQYGKHVALRLFGPTGYGQAYTWRAQARAAMARNHS